MTITTTIVGLSPILLHNPAGLASKKSRTIPTAEDEAAAGCYWSADGGTLVLPAWSLYRCFIRAAGAYKIKRRSLAPFLCGSVRFEPEFLPFGTQTYTIDTRRAVVQRNGVMRSRPRLDNWQLPLTLEIEEQDIPIVPSDIPAQLLEVFREGGRRIGVGDFRLEKNGPFGKFGVTNWQIERSHK